MLLNYHHLILPLAALALGWVADRLFGDPPSLPHPVVGFGKMISFLEKRFNHPPHQKAMGAACTFSLILMVYLATWLFLKFLSPWPVAWVIASGVLIFFCLAATTLVSEVIEVFKAVDRSVEDGRKQVARIVGRDTASLSPDEIRRAALETLAENLSDGVIAPLFWLALLGVPGMMAYKMVNTLDSMIGYKNERFRDFGCVAAKTDDVANWIPARLTALLMIFAGGMAKISERMAFVTRFGRCHASPNSGFPESALAAILDCRFGGTHDYFGSPVYKPYIGSNPRPLCDNDLKVAVRVNRRAEVMAVLLAALIISVKAVVL